MEVIKLGAEYGQPLKKKSIFSLKKAKGTIFEADFLNIYVLLLLFGKNRFFFLLRYFFFLSLDCFFLFTNDMISLNFLILFYFCTISNLDLS